MPGPLQKVPSRITILWVLAYHAFVSKLTGLPKQNPRQWSKHAINLLECSMRVSNPLITKTIYIHSLLAIARSNIYLAYVAAILTLGPFNEVLFSRKWNGLVTWARWQFNNYSLTGIACNIMVGVFLCDKSCYLPAINNININEIKYQLTSKYKLLGASLDWSTLRKFNGNN